MRLASLKLLGPFVLLWFFATVSAPNGYVGLVIAMGAVFVGIVISMATNLILAELKKVQVRLEELRPREQTHTEVEHEELESWKSH